MKFAALFIADIRPSEFKAMIASFMRSDPDIILMGEVRDLDSAELAIEAAITGHKVLTTIHTPRASQIIERFEQLGIERMENRADPQSGLRPATHQGALPLLQSKKAGTHGTRDPEIQPSRRNGERRR